MKFCRIPFSEFRILYHYSGLCCGGYVKGGMECLESLLGNKSLMEVWNSEKAQEFRRTILDGSFKYCNPDNCPVFNNLEDTSTVIEPFFQDIIAQKRVILPPPSYISLDYDDTCNLSCPQCRESIKSNKGDLENIETIHNKVVNELDNPERLQLCGTGEALASPTLRNFLLRWDNKRFKSTKITLRTNGLLLNNRLWEKLGESQNHIDEIFVSIDAATKETYSVVRRGGNFNDLLENMEFISSLRRNGKISKLLISFVVQKNNFKEMGDFVDLCRRWGPDIIYFGSLFPSGAYIDSKYEDQLVHIKTSDYYEEYCEVLNDPRLQEKNVQLVPQLKIKL